LGPHEKYYCHKVVSKTPIILLVEDLEDDVTLIRRAFGQAGLTSPLQVVRDGEQVLAYLGGTGKYANRDEFPLPDLILLDLKMPGMDGFEVLQWLRNQPGISRIAVIVLTSSDNLYDVNRAYALGANTFLVKPTDFNNYVNLTKLVSDFWINTAKLPESARPISKPKTISE
jgi:CheY-like chemotaxis protein